MSTSVRKALKLSQKPTTTLPQQSTHKWLAPTYGAKVQYSPNATTAQKIDKRSITRMKSITGNFLYIYRAVDPTMIVAHNEIGSEQASPTIYTVNKTQMLMDYAAM